MRKGQWGGKTIKEYTKNYFDFDNVKSKIVIASSLFWRLKKKLPIVLHLEDINER
jgi:hypothetical protein